MYLNKQKKPNGDIYLSIREKYHVPKVGSREKTVRVFDTQISGKPYQA